jgi:zinc dependent phospholipase C
MKSAAILFVMLSVVAAPPDAAAYSVLSHEANVDALWDTGIRPLLLRRYPQATSDDLLQARAYAYGGSVIQDLGYYPFGSHFFTNLTHYVRTGDFVEALIREAHDVNEFAFALGALAHYASDNVGHPEGVNRAVGLMYPKLRARYGNSVTYADSPATHVVVEFSFDVVQAAAGAYVSDAYKDFIGFKVAKPVLERAFAATYGLEMKDVFLTEDLAIGTYRHAISQTIPAITRIAWRDKHEEIAKLRPGIGRERIEFTFSQQEYDKLYGAQYRKPGLLARFLGVLYKLVPKIGPLRPLQFKAPTKEAEALFLESVKDTRERYRLSLEAAARGRLNLANTDFDTGKPTTRGEYALADQTYVELLHRLVEHRPAAMPDDLRAHITAFFAAAPSRTASRKERKHAEDIRKDLVALNEGAKRGVR